MVDANQAEIEDPDLIYPDEVFVLPELGEPSPPEPVLPEDPSLNEPTHVPPTTTDRAPSTTITTAPPSPTRQPTMPANRTPLMIPVPASGPTCSSVGERSPP